MDTSHKRTCPDCGNAPTNHLIHKIGVWNASVIVRLDRVGKPIVDRLDLLLTWISNRICPGVFRVLAFFHVGHIEYVPPARMSPRERILWEEGVRCGIAFFAYMVGTRGAIFTVATYNGASIVYETIPRPFGHISKSSDWIDDKHLMKQAFIKNSIPVAKGGVARTWKEAELLFSSLTLPVIVKPSRGSRSRHTTTHIETREELKRAWEKAKQLSPWVIVEEELEGQLYRGTVIGGEVVGILRREPASVIGDGVHTIQELIEIENRDPKRQGPIFHQIELHDFEHEKELLRQGYALTSIPEKGIFVTLSQKASRGLGGGTTDCTDEAHPEIKNVLKHAALVLDESLVGIDFIIDDIRASFQEQKRAGIIECNSAPFIDLHHYPLHGASRNAAGALWHLIFPELRTPLQSSSHVRE